MSEWKAGDIVGLRVDRAESDAVSVVVSRAFGTTITTPVMNEYIEPLPTPDPHQALKDAVVEAAKAMILWRRSFGVLGTPVAEVARLAITVDALTAAQTPLKPDPVEVFYEAVDRQHLCDNVFHPSHRNCLKNVPACHCRRYIAEGLAAVEAARGAK